MHFIFTMQLQRAETTHTSTLRTLRQTYDRLKLQYDTTATRLQTELDAKKYAYCFIRALYIICKIPRLAFIILFGCMHVLIVFQCGPDHRSVCNNIGHHCYNRRNNASRRTRGAAGSSENALQKEVGSARSSVSGMFWTPARIYLFYDSYLYILNFLRMV